MVRTRSEEKLNDIFLHLCTSPEIRVKFSNTRYHLPLPTLKPIKSNSCSDLTEIEQTHMTDGKPTEDSDTLDLTTTFYFTLHEQKTVKDRARFNYIPLTSMESTGFTLQSSSYTANRSFSLFGSPLTNNSETSTDGPYSSIESDFHPFECFSNDRTLPMIWVTERDHANICADIFFSKLIVFGFFKQNKLPLAFSL